MRPSSILCSCLAVAALAALSLDVVSAGNPPILLPRDRGGEEVIYDFHVTLGQRAPDCEDKRVILVNGLFQPTIELRANDTVTINVYNHLPADYPMTGSGISLHFHGFSMSVAPWYAGMPYVNQCPIGPADKMVYVFQAYETPGPYMWYAPSTGLRADGLQGAVIVRAIDEDVTGPDGGPVDREQGVPRTEKPWGKVGGEQIFFISERYKTDGNALQMKLNQPGQKTVDTPASLLVNGRGTVTTCSGAKNPPPRPSLNGLPQQVCAVEKYRRDKNIDSGCGYEEFGVRLNRTYLVHIINGGSLYVSVCFDSHQVTVFQADTTPVIPYLTNCVDVNAGERYTLIFRPTQRPANYWVSFLPQYRAQMPATYAFIRYKDVILPEARSANPVARLPQPGSVLPWTPQLRLRNKVHPNVLAPKPPAAPGNWYNLYAFGKTYTRAILTARTVKTVVLAATQETLQNRMVRWALNKVSTPTNPPCVPLMTLLKTDAAWLRKNTINGRSPAAVSAANNGMLGANDDRPATDLYISGRKSAVYTAPAIAAAVGVHAVQLRLGEVVDVVLSNAPGLEPQSFYLHGNRFWLLGYGTGTYNPATHRRTLNFANPQLRDTATVPAGGWMVVRFYANHPGIWPLGSANMWHRWMGNQMYFVVAPERLPPAPTPAAGFATCPRTCIENFGAFGAAWIRSKFNTVKYPAA